MVFVIKTENFSLLAKAQKLPCDLGKDLLQ